MGGEGGRTLPDVYYPLPGMRYGCDLQTVGMTSESLGNHVQLLGPAHHRPLRAHVALQVCNRFNSFDYRQSLILDLFLPQDHCSRCRIGTKDL